MSALLVDTIPLCTGFELCWHLAWFHFEKITGASGVEPRRWKGESVCTEPHIISCPLLRLAYGWG